jgi:hypothetical protein
MGKVKWGKLAAPVSVHDTLAGCFWQSRARLEEFPKLLDIESFAKELRRTWP